jgi:hypothetical protein
MWQVRRTKRLKKEKTSKTLKVELKISSLLKSDIYTHRFQREIRAFSFEVYLKINFNIPKHLKKTTRVAS